MKERPMIFNDEMVRAILGGRKTQTRRPVKPANGLQSEWLTPELIRSVPSGYLATTDHGIFGWQMEHPRGGPLGFVECPYGVPGDRIWVRECWAKIGDNRDDAFATPHGVYFRADEATSRDLKWRPSIHMPRWACRITLEITAVRVERVQDISEADAIAEGCRWKDYGKDGSGHQLNGWSMVPSTHHAMCLPTARMAFANFINEIYGGKNWNLWYNDDTRHPMPLWEQNPWVWVVEFKRAIGGQALTTAP